VNAKTTFMRAEVAEIPDAVAAFLDGSRKTLARSGQRMRDRNPPVVATVARGSSDHAASYLKYAIELSTGVPVASLGPSVASIYGARLKLPNAACLTISQSGKSPDIVDMAKAAGKGGALTFAITNTPDSPLAEACDELIELCAGPERSVAATKTFVNSAVAGLALLAHWTEDGDLLGALEALPDRLAGAIDCDWSGLSQAVGDRDSLFILGRGPAFAIASEAALKFKETSSIHAEAYSAAEVMHGPVSLVGKGFPVLVLVARDAAETSSAETADSLADKGAAAFATTALSRRAAPLPFVATGHPLTDPLALIVSFYAFIEAFARSRGLDPDKPVNLRKVTETR
jgi:glutamine---fructose-6-phosphate transaminase (isomerizing)